VTFPREAVSCWKDPVARLGSRSNGPLHVGEYQRSWLDLNQNLSKFWRRDERAESEWDLDSRNVKYGIFCATPKKHAK
jgi:hypothetical protein